MSENGEPLSAPKSLLGRVGDAFVWAWELLTAGTRGRVPRTVDHYTPHLTQRSRLDWWRYFLRHFLVADIAITLFFVWGPPDPESRAVFSIVVLVAVGIAAHSRSDMPGECSCCGKRLRYYQTAMRLSDQCVLDAIDGRYAGKQLFPTHFVPMPLLPKRMSLLSRDSAYFASHPKLRKFVFGDFGNMSRRSSFTAVVQECVHCNTFTYQRISQAG